MARDTSHRGQGGERIAKAIARAGLASRRDAEAMIDAGRVTVNGKPARVAMNVSESDKIIVDGTPLPAREAARVWLYHKPSGLVTTEKDDQGRPTVFDAVRERLGRVLSVGRLDLTSEGLLLLTNDGDLKRRLELPETGWLRRYRVRVNGHPDEAALDRLRAGIEVDGERFAPMQITLDRTQGANAWLTVGLREGRNREIRRAMDAVGVVVARLIRVSYGPFQLGKLPSGEVEELRPRILRDQLGGLFDGDFADSKRDAPTIPSKRAPRDQGPRDRRSPGDKPRGKPRFAAEDGKPNPRSGPGKGKRADERKGRAKAAGAGTSRGADRPAGDKPRSGAKPDATRRNTAKGQGARRREGDDRNLDKPKVDTRRANPSISLRGKPRAGPKRRKPGPKTDPKR